MLDSPNLSFRDSVVSFRKKNDRNKYFGMALLRKKIQGSAPNQPRGEKTNIPEASPKV